MAEKVPVGDGPAGALVDRIVSVVVTAAAVTIVWVLASIDPDPRGFGTHEQLGMTPCGWPATADIPCPTCGVTTSACHLVHLAPWSAVRAQPFGAALALAGIALAGYAVFCLATHRSFLDRMARLPFGSIVTWGLVLFLGSWLYKYLSFA